MEKGKPGLLWENDGGSTRLNGELEARRLERRPMRLCFGDPRLRAMGVELVVLGLGERALRTEGIDDCGVETEGLALNGHVTSEK